MSNPNLTEDFILAIVTVLALATVAVGWYKVWVEPNDAITGQIVACMGEDMSREAYDECRGKVLANRVFGD